jgi:heptosyltransferase-2
VSRLPSGRVLVRLPSWLGDLVAVEPAVSALASAVGPSRLSLAAPDHLLPLLEAWLPEARRIGHRGRGGERARDWRGHELALLLTGSFRSAWVARLAGIPRRIGWQRDGRGWLLTEGARPALERGGAPIGLGVVGRWPRVLPRSVGAGAGELVASLGVGVRRVRPELPLVERARRRVEEQIGARRPGLLVNVGGRPGSAKAWGAERWAAALAELADLGSPWLVCGPGEQPRLEALAAALDARGLPYERAWRDRPADLPELAALCARAALVLTTDSGPRHVARAVGAPCVTLFGPTDPRHTAAPGPPEARLRLELDCSPCHAESCALSGERERRCLEALDPALVVAAARDLLSSSQAG